MDFGSRLKALRKQSGMTQKQLAERLGVTKSVVSFYELKERAPSPDVLIRCARIFHVTTDHLLGLDEVSRIDITGLCEEDVALLRTMADRLRDRRPPADNMGG